jgi:hypothetical protein
MRDVAIARFIEETTIKNMNIIIHYNNSDIIQYFTTHKTILKSLFDMINSDQPDVKYEGMAFLMELNHVSKDLIQTKIYFYEALCEMNILEVIENMFVYLAVGRKIRYFKHKHLYADENLSNQEMLPEDKKKHQIMEINSIEIMICCLTVVPSIVFVIIDIVKNYILSKNQKLKEYSMLNELCNILLYQENFGSKYEVKFLLNQIGELLKFLLDNEVNERKNEFYDLFYNKFLKKFVDFLSIRVKDYPQYKNEIIESKQLIIDILCHCLKLHG